MDYKPETEVIYYATHKTDRKEFKAEQVYGTKDGLIDYIKHNEFR